MSDSFDTTLGIHTELEPTYTVLGDHLKELGFVEEEAYQFRIFCTPKDAVEYFRYPQKTEWKGVKIIPVAEMPRHFCSLIRSTEY